MKIGIIGAGISGLSIARMLKESGHEVTVYEREAQHGGLVRCDRVEGVLYHRVGGHVFNSRNQTVLDWFWQHFSKDDFQLATRHAVVALGESHFVEYPIENHLYQLPEEMREAVLDDLLEIARAGYPEDEYFGAFLRHRFGKTLYAAYFDPYNRKIWRRSLEDMPLAWLQGKLPMPTVKEILSANIGQVKEMKMVHSTFHYPRMGGSQFIADTLATGLDIHHSSPAESLENKEGRWLINHENEVDRIVFCGNVKELPDILTDDTGGGYLSKVAHLEAHGTTSVLCEIAANPYSWIYMPNTAHESHRIICTGNFAASNSPEGMHTATIEFSDELSREEIERQLKLIPLSPRYIAHHYCPYTYPVQGPSTREIVEGLKQQLEPQGLYLLGRFAEWEYSNMDAAMAAAMSLVSRMNS